MLTCWIINSQWFRQRLIVFIWKRHSLPLTITSENLPWRFQLQRCILALECVLTYLFHSFLLAEALIKISVQQPKALGTDLSSALIVFKSHLAYSPGGNVPNCAGNKISPEWDGFRGLFSFMPQQLPSHHTTTTLTR